MVGVDEFKADELLLLLLMVELLKALLFDCVWLMVVDVIVDGATTP